MRVPDSPSLHTLTNAVTLEVWFKAASFYKRNIRVCSWIFLSEPRPATILKVSEGNQIIDRVQIGDSKASEQLLPLAYEELRKRAAAKMAREFPGHTLQTTAPVREAWLRIGGENQGAWRNRAHLLGAAAEAMRRILVENARCKLRLKRSAGHGRVELEKLGISGLIEDEKVLQVNPALESLAAYDPDNAEMVKLRFFVGLTNEEIAALLNVNEKTVRRRRESAKVLLFQAIKADE
jgi:RNA polymerase sigma factor (TIGR02999 family)